LILCNMAGVMGRRIFAFSGLVERILSGYPLVQDGGVALMRTFAVLADPLLFACALLRIDKP